MSLRARLASFCGNFANIFNDALMWLSRTASKINKISSKGVPGGNSLVRMCSAFFVVLL
jgi:hypothetical protein